jgi:hypothetical protein
MWSPEYLMGDWRPTIGDPTFMGWFTVGSYFFCALVALYAAWLNRGSHKRSLFFWSMIMLLMICLGVNKQLDLQSLLTEIGRQIARAQGWMHQRRVVQFGFIVIFATVSITVFTWFTLKFRDLFKRFSLAFCGLFFLISFIIIRAASFHHFDALIGFRISGVRMNWILELTGIYMIVLAGFKEIFLLTSHKV